MRWGYPLLALALPVVLSSGCSESTGPGSDRQDILVPGVQEMTLRVGEEKAVGNSVLRLAFGQVLEDSRCPIDVVCVWQGNALVELGVRAGMGPTVPIRLNTTLEPRSTVWSGVRISLLELQPAPRAAEPTKPDAYQVKVRLEPVS
ncbi:MAG: hypothetical protein FIA95_17355 [Gemmatimonadetes bacterium]|nr:hypothetical protein [Gemmatimonadota bacterium]